MTSGQAGDAGAPIRTDRASYTLTRAAPPARVETVIVATYRNPSGEPVYVPPCNGGPPRFRLEKKVGSGWVKAFEPECAAAPAPDQPPLLRSGEARTDTLRIRAFTGMHPRFQVSELPGTYRVVYQAYSGPPLQAGLPGDTLALGHRTSNEFELREQA